MENLVITVNEDSTTKQTFKRTHEYWLDRGRKWWRTKPSRALDAARLIVLDSNGIVVAVGEIEGVKKDLANRSKRVEILVEPEEENPLIGQTFSHTNKSQNPVSYVLAES